MMAYLRSVDLDLQFLFAMLTPGMLIANDFKSLE